MRGWGWSKHRKLSLRLRQSGPRLLRVFWCPSDPFQYAFVVSLVVRLVTDLDDAHSDCPSDFRVMASQRRTNPEFLRGWNVQRKVLSPSQTIVAKTPLLISTRLFHATHIPSAFHSGRSKARQVLAGIVGNMRAKDANLKSEFTDDSQIGHPEAPFVFLCSSSTNEWT